MRRRERGQVIFIVAILLVVVLTILAVIIDGGRLLIEQQEMNRAADAAGKAGLLIVGDHLVTQVVDAQTAAARVTVTATPMGSTGNPTLTPLPAADDFFSWVTDDHRQTLVAPPMQTLVATHVWGSIEENVFGFSTPDIKGIEVSYPDHYHEEDQNIQILVRIDRSVAFIFGSLFNLEEGVLSGNRKQNIPQR